MNDIEIDTVTYESNLKKKLAKKEHPYILLDFYCEFLCVSMLRDMIEEVYKDINLTL